MDRPASSGCVEARPAGRGDLPGRSSRQVSVLYPSTQRSPRSIEVVYF